MKLIHTRSAALAAALTVGLVGGLLLSFGLRPAPEVIGDMETAAAPEFSIEAEMPTVPNLRFYPKIKKPNSAETPPRLGGGWDEITAQPILNSPLRSIPHGDPLPTSSDVPNGPFFTTYQSDTGSPRERRKPPSLPTYRSTTEASGRVESVIGAAFVSRSDGERDILNEGDAIFQGDLVETGPEGAVTIEMTDQSIFSLNGDGRIRFDEAVYDPDAQVGRLSATLLRGAFTFISGEIANTGPDAMVLTTRVATIGIRGTVGALVLPPDGPLTVTLATIKGEGPGEIVVANRLSTRVLNQVFQSARIADFDLPIGAPFLLPEQKISELLAQLRRPVHLSP